MADFTGLIEVIKQAALDAVTASNPVNILFGKVTSLSPLKINIEQKMTLEMEHLILARSVTEHTIEMTVNHETELETEHRHIYTGRKSFRVHNGLMIGDEVILVRLHGGQKFLVIDRLG